MRYTIGRFLQGAALILLPLAVLWEATGALGRDRFGVADMLVMMIGGVLLFVTGWIIQGTAPRS